MSKQETGGAGQDCCASPSLLSVEEALAQILDSARSVVKTEKEKLIDALGRVLAEDIHSGIDVPAYDNSAMDGYAVRSADCAVAGASLRVTQRIPAGEVGKAVEPGCAARIFTGAPIPTNADAVVMQERCEREGDQVTINEAVKSGTNIRSAGEDIKKNSRVLKAGTLLRHQELGMLASVGMAKLSVYRRLRVAVFFTGDELVEPGHKPGKGQIYNSNRYTLIGLLEKLGCEVIDFGIVEDDLAATRYVLEEVSNRADLVITSGGVSVGEEDYVRIALEQLGELSLWRVAMKPGKPVAFGSIHKTLFLGLPGNPVAVFVTSLIFARPLILKMQGVTDYQNVFTEAKAAFEWPAGKRCEYLRARLNKGPSGAEVEIYPHQGSGVLSSACWADVLVEVPVDTAVRKGMSVKLLQLT